MVKLCRLARIPARLVCGFVIRARRRARPHVWVEAYAGRTWVPYDPEYGYAGELPANYLPVRRDAAEIVRAGKDVAVEPVFSIQASAPPAGIAGEGKKSPADILSLSRLPVSMQHTLAVLLLLPAGALITSVWRNLIGLQTFGTFTPSLLALSFVYADLRTGILVFVLVMGIGLAGRFLLDRLKLLMVPRLSVILTIAVLCVTLSVSVLDYLGLTPSAQAVILPLVIIVMMVERFYIRSEEDGPLAALKLLLWTFVVAGFCTALLRWQALAWFVVRFPEVELLVAAALLLIGRYSGYRLTELVRFRDLAAKAK